MCKLCYIVTIEVVGRTNLKYIKSSVSKRNKGFTLGCSKPRNSTRNITWCVEMGWGIRQRKCVEILLLENIHCRILNWLQIGELDISNSTPCLLVYSSVYSRALLNQVRVFSLCRLTSCLINKDMTL